MEYLLDLGLLEAKGVETGDMGDGEPLKVEEEDDDLEDLEDDDKDDEEDDDDENQEW